MSPVRFLKLLAGRVYAHLPCAHEWAEAHTGPLGAYQTRHHLACNKCGARRSCDCPVCREPWRDW